MPEFMGLAYALPHAGKHGHALVYGEYSMHEFHDEDRFADAGTAEETCLAAADKGAEQVYDLDARLQQAPGSGGLGKGYRGAVDIAAVHRCQWRPVIQGFAEDIQHPAQALFGYRHLQRRTRIVYGHAPLQAGSGVQGDGPCA